MAFNVGAAIGTLGLDTSGFVGGILQAHGLMSLFPSWVTNLMANPLLGLIGILKDCTTVVSGWLSGITDMDDAADELAQSLGVDVEFLTAFAKAAEMNGSSLPEVGQAFQFLNKSMAEAASGNKDTLSTFSRLGVAIADSMGRLRPAEEVMLDLGEAIKNLPDGARRTAAAMDLLGRGGGGLVTTFMQGGAAIQAAMEDARQLGAVTTKSSAESSSDYTNAVKRISNAWEGFKRIVAEPLADILTPYLNSIADWFKTHKDEIKGWIDYIAAGVKKVIQELVRLLSHLGDVYQSIKGIFDLFGAGSNKGFGFQTPDIVIGTVGRANSPATSGSAGGMRAVYNQRFTMNIDGRGGVDQAVAQFRDLMSRYDQQMQSQVSRSAVEAGL